ncbi:MAG: 50S ribosomal protein L24 [Syntrophomonadaceae bacterium]|nr:50S ribosomal protein L24 [Syntrophomonadaceae bacterium]
MKIRKGDTIEVIAGRDLGKRGKVLKVDPERNRVVVEGINKVKKHQKPTRTLPQGGILNIEAPVHASNVMLVCTKCQSPTRVGRKFLENGEKVRVCRKCGEVID